MLGRVIRGILNVVKCWKVVWAAAYEGAWVNVWTGVCGDGGWMAGCEWGDLEAAWKDAGEGAWECA